MTNQQRFRQLCAIGDATQEEAARLIAEQTMRPCSPRTVRSWLANPDSVTARPCPNWAIIALETRLKALNRISV